MADEEKFLSRWSRLKREAAVEPVATGAAAPAPAPVELPPVDSLGFDSDFTGFLREKVDEKLKQAALKKLFHSPHFNQMDGLDVYIDDYNSFEPIPDAMLRQLNHAQDLLFRQDEEQGADVPASDGDAPPVVALPVEGATAESAAIGAAETPQPTDQSPVPSTVSSSGSDKS